MRDELPAVEAPAVAAASVEVPLALRGAGATARTRAVILSIAAATAVMASSALWIGLTSDHLRWPAATAAYSAYLVAAPMLVGLYWVVRRPASRFGPLLMGFGTLAWIYSFESSDVPLLFDGGS